MPSATDHSADVSSVTSTNVYPLLVSAFPDTLSCTVSFARCPLTVAASLCTVSLPTKPT